MKKYGILIIYRCKEGGKPYYSGIGGPFESLSKCFRGHREHKKQERIIGPSEEFVIAQFGHDWIGGITQSTVEVLFKKDWKTNEWEMIGNE